ncbi:MAG: hypothetical protein AAGJ08_26130 [Cyanobacteria bacterium P01_H01_bin.35]
MESGAFRNGKRINAQATSVGPNEVGTFALMLKQRPYRVSMIVVYSSLNRCNG